MATTHNRTEGAPDGLGNLRRLDYFAAVVETGSFTAAADRLGITKSVVSQQVARQKRDFRTLLCAPRKAEYCHLAKFDGVEALEIGVHDYIRYYNHERIELKLQGLSSVDYRLRNIGLPPVSRTLCLAL